jgi:hypothetical protein
MEPKAVSARYDVATQLPKYKDELQSRHGNSFLLWLVAPQQYPSSINRKPIRVNRYLPVFLVVFFSITYFIDVGIRASEKYFWYDELLTVYFSRLPNLHAIWNALGSGVDSNPPLFFLLTRASEAAFGEGAIGTRVPEILGFWAFCLCIFWFVARRVGPIPGLIAMLLPTLTGAFYYAYEARPHAIVLGCCGIALVCWQHAGDSSSVGSRRTAWLTGFSFALFCAFMLHAYALVLTIPFGLTGLLQGFRGKEIKGASGSL